MKTILIDQRGLTRQQYESLGCQGVWHQTIVDEHGEPVSPIGRALIKIIDPKYVSEVK